MIGIAITIVINSLNPVVNQINKNDKSNSANTFNIYEMMNILNEKTIELTNINTSLFLINCAKIIVITNDNIVCDNPNKMSIYTGDDKRFDIKTATKITKNY